MAGPRLSIRIDLTNVERIGPGKVALLEAIQSNGSISAAARSLGMSYRRAWLLVEEVNCALRESAVTAETGGSSGGGAVLTLLASASSLSTAPSKSKREERRVESSMPWANLFAGRGPVI